MFWENSIETCILSRVKQITSPGWMHETSARTWCTGKTQRDRVEREVREGIGMENTCKLMADFGAQENKVCHYFHCFPSICHEMMGPDAMILVFWMLSFKPTFSLFSFTFIKRLLSSFLLSAIRVMSSAYLRLLMLLPTILIPAVLHPAQHFIWCTLHIS